MKTKIKGKIEVEITEINVFDENYYEIHYTYTLDGKNWKSNIYESDFEGWTKKQWLDTLKTGEALKYIYQEIVEVL